MILNNKIESTEKREHVRHNCEAVLEWSYFNKAKFWDAKLLNFSESGAYLETGHELKPGVTIFMKIIMLPSSTIDSLEHVHPRSISLGDVQWCVYLSGKGHSRYGVGIRFPFSN